MGVRVGTCGFAGSRREHYRAFPTVEVQQTFYRPPRPETLRRWREEAPSGFQFTLKAHQAITHPAGSPTYRRAGLAIPPERRDAYGFFRPTPEVGKAWETTLACARALGAPVVLFQCPASFEPTEENLANLRDFFQRARAEAPDLLFAWEPRGPTWTPTLVRRLCGELGLLHAVDPFETEPATGDPLYLRLHGGPGYRHRYTDAELAWLAGWVRRREGWVFFNNLARDEDARRFLALLDEGGEPRGPAR